jgi:hypothetical protein
LSWTSDYFFNKWFKNLAHSINSNAPWASLHVHIFNSNQEDISWCKLNKVSFTEEIIPNNADKKGYICVSRFLTACELYNNNISTVCLDADSLMVRPMLEQVFSELTLSSWVTVRPGEFTALGGAICLGKDSFRDELKSLLKEEINSKGYRWFLDQDVFNALLSSNKVKAMDIKFSDFYCSNKSFFWQLKGERKNCGSSLNRLLFLNESKKYAK